MSHVEHKATAPRSVRCYVITISDTRTEETDTAGRAIAELLRGAGHQVVGRTIVKDDPGFVRGAIERQLADPNVQAVITTGGTGISSRDSTYEAVSALLWKRLDGFGELFRMLSYEQIGSAAVLSRACAGLVAGCARTSRGAAGRRSKQRCRKRRMRNGSKWVQSSKRSCARPRSFRSYSRS